MTQPTITIEELRPAPPRIQKLRGIDLYCGAGGMTTGAHASGYVHVDLAVNHWRPAILTHSANHPETRHICAEMEHVDPHGDRTLPDCDLVMAGVECTHHSNAKGGAPVCDQKRSSARNVLDWVKAKQPLYVVIENVREFKDWGPTRLKLDKLGKRVWDKKHRQWAREADPTRKGEFFQQWVVDLTLLGYLVEWRLLNAADFGEATKRVRLFIIARRGGGPIPWPEPTHAQEANGKPRWNSAASIINWQLRAPSIFGRKKPLAKKTLLRVKIGLLKFNTPQSIREWIERFGYDPLVHLSGFHAEPFVVKLWGTNDVAAIDRPLPTITAAGNHLWLAQPYLVNMKGRSTAADIGLPLPTVTAHAQHLNLAQPFVVQTQGPGVGDLRYAGVQSTVEPLRTVLTRINHGIATPFIVGAGGCTGNGRPFSADQPLKTVMCNDRKSLAVPYLFALDQQSGGGSLQLATRPLSTITVKQRHCLATPFVYQLIGRGAGRSYAIDEPLPTIVAARENFGVAQPFMIAHFGERNGQVPRAFGLDAPLPVVTSRGAGYLAMPYLLPRQGIYDSQRLKRCQSIDEPLNTITASHSPAHLVMPYLVDVNHGEGGRSRGGRVHSIDGPLGTITGRRHHGLIVPEGFIVNYYGTGVAHSTDEPLSTVTTKHRHGLTLFGDTPTPSRKLIVLNEDEADLYRTMLLLGIDEILFRMLVVDELARAMGLPEDYVIHGNKAEQIKQIGNAVCVKVMKAICEAIGDYECELRMAA